MTNLTTGLPPRTCPVVEKGKEPLSPFKLQPMRDLKDKKKNKNKIKRPKILLMKQGSMPRLPPQFT